jgi:HlyD family secretion protein
MDKRSSGNVLLQIHALYSAGTLGGLSDRQLVERFIGQHDAVAELAFATLVERHGPMVFGVCRRMLGPHDAEDAFQATFLVLVRQARSIRVDDSIGGWLYGVATRVAARARANNVRRHKRERTGLDRIDVAAREPATSAGDLADLQSVLIDELRKLPVRFQAPVFLCDLEGSSHEEAARQLGWPVGTVKSRLARARARLRGGLIRRGLAPPELSGILPLVPAALPRRVVVATCRSAKALALGVPSTSAVITASVATLTAGVLRTTALTKLKFAIVAILLITTGSVAVVSQATAQR